MDESWFPLQTIQSLSDRWGITKQAVQSRAQSKSFPKPKKGMIANSLKRDEIRLFALSEIKKYEKEKGLNHVK